MIRLDRITRTLQFRSNAAKATNDLPIVVCYSDKTSYQYNGATQLSKSDGVTLVTICDGPSILEGESTSIIRDIDSISIVNVDTVLVTGTVFIVDNTELYHIIRVILAVGDHLEYTHANGWKVVDENGNIKTI